jgi:hypothetical protein
MWHWKVERHAKKLNALSARYRVEARKIGFLVDTLRTREDAGTLSGQAITWGNTALVEYREGTHEVEMAWAARDVPSMNRAVRRIRSARSLLERALDAGRMESA